MLTDLIIQTPWKQCNPAEQRNKTDKGGNEANNKRHQKERKKKKKKKGDFVRILPLQNKNAE